MKNVIEKLDDYLVLRNYSKATRKSYVGAVRKFHKWCSDRAKDPDFDKPNAHHNYLITRTKKGYAWQTINNDYSAIKMLYTKILDRDWDVNKIPRPRKEKTHPLILSKNQLEELINHGSMFKHQFYMLFLYSTGLRLSESLNLKIEDINIERLQIHVKRGKGNKSRYINFSKSILPILNVYLNKYRPTPYLFNGMYQSSHWSESAAQKCIKNAVAKAGLSKLISAHTLRHCYATHHLEKGTDLFTLKKQLGHSNLRTTARYIHLCTRHFQQIKHPVEDLCLRLKHTNLETCLGNGANNS